MQQFLTSRRGKIHEKNLGTKFGPKRPNRAQNLFFCHFIKFGSLVFIEIALNDNLQQFLTSSRGKIDEKTFWEPSLG